MKKNILKRLVQLTVMLVFAAMVSSSTFYVNLTVPGSDTVFAERDYIAEMEERKTLPVQSNETANWPEGPAIGARAAIVMEMDTHTVLYAKNIHEKCYPASTTKIFTCLLAMQNCTLDETITFSHDAIYDVPSDGSKLGGIDEGDTMLMEHALYCVLVQSANEVASAVGEHVAEKLGMEKDVDSFTALMNQKAKQLGCEDSHFVNCNGLYDDNHYTSAYDLALIGCEFFGNEQLCKMSSTPSYHFRYSPEEEEDRWISSKNQLYKGKPYEYKYLLGSKTGYVSQSRQTLVSAAEKNGMKLVCVIFTEESPYQFEDTVTLFQYGFENFRKVSVRDNEEKYKISTMDLFETENDIFGDSTPLISMENDKYIVLPNTADFSDAESALIYGKEDKPDVIATIDYTYSGVNVGSCNIVFSKAEAPDFSFAADSPVKASSDTGEDETAALAETEKGTEEETKEGEKDDKKENANVIFINVRILLIIVLVIVAAAALIIFIVSVIKNYSFSPRGRSSRRRRMRRRESRIARRSAKKRARQEKRLSRKRRRGRY